MESSSPKVGLNLNRGTSVRLLGFGAAWATDWGGVLDLPLSGWGHRQWLSCACPPSHDDGWRADNAAAQFMGIRTHREGPRPQTSLGLNDKVLDFKPEPKK